MDKLLHEFSVGLFFWQTVLFVIILFLLRKFAWKPILNAVNEREQSIEESLKAAEKAKEEMANLQAANEKLLLEAKEERAKIIKEAKDAKESLISEAKEEAREAAAKITENAKKEIESQKNAVMADIKNEVGTMAVEVASKILRKELKDKKEQDKYLNELVADIKLN